jgi:APA family basic amino acid/polyamine antiporter
MTAASPSAADQTAPAPQSTAGPGFQRRINLFDATMLVAGAMIGSGIFIVSADIARDVGSAGWLLAVWALAGAITLMGALSYAELAAMMPHAGGQYIYLREAYGPLWGFLYGWTLFLVIQTGTIAAVAVAFAKFLGVLIPVLGTNSYLLTLGDFKISAGQCLAAAMIGGLTFVNCLGVTAGTWIQNIFTVAKTLALMVLIVVGLWLAADAATIAANWQSPWAGIYDTLRYQTLAQALTTKPWLSALMVVGGAMVGALFSADAWHNVTFTAGETINPQRNLPLSMVLGVGLVIGLYLLANVAYLRALPLHGSENGVTPVERGIDHAKDDRVGTAVLEKIAPRYGAPFMAFAIMISTFGCLNGLILMGPRLYYAMAQDRLFFAAAGELSARGVPAKGLLMQGAWSLMLVFSGTYSQLLDYVIFAALLFYALTVAGLFVLRRSRPHADRPYLALGYPWLPAAYILLCSLIMLDLLIVKPMFTWPGLAIVLTGVPAYFIWRRKKNRE